MLSQATAQSIEFRLLNQLRDDSTNPIAKGGRG
jgi:hypothetical protein